MKKKTDILFLTTLNLAANPRLVKEVRLSIKLNFNVTVICFTFNNWSNDINRKLLEEFQGINIIQINGERSSFLPWFFSSAAEKLFRYLSIWVDLPLKILSLAVSRRSLLLLNTLDRVQSASWVIGHNPGALYPTIVASRKFNCKSGFDVEDYHPGEGNNPQLQKNTLNLMKKVFLGFSYVSFASDSIMDECNKQIDLTTTRKLVINNAFSQSEFTVPEEISDEKLRLVWFSQHIDKGRGLESVISIVKKHGDKMKLTLFGNCNIMFREQYINGNDAIILGGVVKQSELHSMLAQYDIGLAAEDAISDMNRNICLTNKIWAYFQSGLFILASDTIAQKRFLENYSSHGICYDNVENLEAALLKLYEDKLTVRNHKKPRYENAQQMSWESESKKLQTNWTE